MTVFQAKNWEVNVIFVTNAAMAFIILSDNDLTDP